MKIFILEDNSDRIRLFSRNLIGHEVILAKDAAEAISLFQSHHDFDVMFLDHDLGGKEMVDSEEENTGYTVAKYMQSRNIFADRMIIHSCNPVGAENMKAVLPGAYCISFASLNIQEIIR